MLLVTVSARPPRGDLLGPDRMPSDPTMAKRSEALVAAILTDHFT